MKYAVEICDPYFNPLEIRIPVTQLEAARSFNKPGAFSITLPKQYKDYINYFRKDMVIKLYRIYPNGMHYLLGNTYWFLRKMGYKYGSNELVLSGHDTLGLLARYLVAYTKETDYAEKTADYGLSDFADNLIKAFLRENIGSLALDMSRDLSTYIEIEADQSQGAIGEKEASFQKLDSVINDLVGQSESQGIPLYCDLLPNGQKLRFITKIGQLGIDRTKTLSSVRFDVHSNTLVNAELTWDWEKEVTYGYIGGDGEGSAKLIVEIDNTDAKQHSPFSRVEAFYDQGQVYDSDYLITLGKAAMQKDHARLYLTGDVAETATQQFGKHYNYGDRVLMAIDRYQTSAVIDAFSVKMNGGKEDLSIKLTGEVLI